MKGHIYIQPRSTGKTTQLIGQLLKTDNAILITRSENDVRMVYRKMGCDTSDTSIVRPLVFACNESLFKKARGINIKNVFIDEYLFFDYKQRDIINRFLHSFDDLDLVVVYTTSDKLYDEQVIDIIRVILSNKIPLEVLNKEWLGRYDSLFSNLLTNPSFKVHPWRDYLRKSISKERFKIEGLGDLYK